MASAATLTLALFRKRERGLASLGRTRERGLAVVVCLVLGGCASRPGHFYQDDGPPEKIPAGMAQVPDAVPRVEPLNPRANRPYSALGRSYTPDTSDAPFEQRGMASWYGKQYHGNPTASGEPYDMFAMTAAHPTLPIPSYARVTKNSDGRSVIVRINDRGPFLQDRVIDLSYAAAARLGIVGPGSAEVTVQKITARDIAAGNAGARAVPVSAAAAPQGTGDAAPATALAAPPAVAAPVEVSVSTGMVAAIPRTEEVPLAPVASAETGPAEALQGAKAGAEPPTPTPPSAPTVPDAAAPTLPPVPATPAPQATAPAAAAAVAPPATLPPAVAKPGTSPSAVVQPGTSPSAVVQPTTSAPDVAQPVTAPPAAPIQATPAGPVGKGDAAAAPVPAASSPAVPESKEPAGPAPAPIAAPKGAGKDAGKGDTPAAGGKWAVQLGAFTVAANAEALREQLQGLLSGADADALPATVREVRIESDGRLHRVLVGGFEERSAAQGSARQLKKLLRLDTTIYRPAEGGPSPAGITP